MRRARLQGSADNYPSSYIEWILQASFSIYIVNFFPSASELFKLINLFQNATSITFLHNTHFKDPSAKRSVRGKALLYLRGTPSIPETYLSSSVAWGLNLRVGWWRQILKKCKFSNRSSGPTVRPPAIVFPSNCFLVSRDHPPAGGGGGIPSCALILLSTSATSSMQRRWRFKHENK